MQEAEAWSARLDCGLVRLTGAAGGGGTGKPPKLRGGAMRVFLSGEGLGSSDEAGQELGYIAKRAGERCQAGGGTARSATVGRGPCDRAFGTARDAGVVLAGCLLDAARESRAALWLGGASGTISTSSVDETEMQGESS